MRPDEVGGRLPERVTEVDPSDGEDRIAAASRALLDQRRPDGPWCFELEADATIPAEYTLLRHFRGELEDASSSRRSDRTRIPIR